MVRNHNQNYMRYKKITFTLQFYHNVGGDYLFQSGPFKTLSFKRVFTFYILRR